MAKRTETLEGLIDRMEVAADKSGCASRFWQQVSIVLIVWEDVKRGWAPTVQYDHRYQQGLRDLADAYRRFGQRLVDAVNQRAFA
jgi:hypothetical protein